MYENKILVNVYILSLSKNCEIFIPINEKIGNITKLLKNSRRNLTQNTSA